MNQYPQHSLLTYVLGIIIAIISITFLAGLQNRDKNTKYKQDQVDNYDSFYGACNDYFSENKFLDLNRVNLVYKDRIAEGVTLDKELGLFNETEASDARVLSTLCQTLDEFSKSESKEVIYDIENPAE